MKVAAKYSFRLDKTVEDNLKAIATFVAKIGKSASTAAADAVGIKNEYYLAIFLLSLKVL